MTNTGFLKTHTHTNKCTTLRKHQWTPLCSFSYLFCTLAPSSPPCRPWSRFGRSWSGRRSHCGLGRTCCRRVRSSWSDSGNEVGTPGWKSVRGNGKSATVHRGSAWRRAGFARSTDLREGGRKEEILSFVCCSDTGKSKGAKHLGKEELCPHSADKSKHSLTLLASKLIWHEFNQIVAC